MGKDQPDTHTTTQTSAPPEYVQPHIEHALNQARGLYDTRGMYSSTQLPGAAQEGFDMQMGAARDPALVDPSIGLAQQTLGGEFLGADALRDASRAELDDVIGGTRSQFESAGRSNSGLANYALGRGVTSALGPAYQRERALQQQMAGMAPGLEASRYMPGQQLSQTALQQRGIEDQYYREPWDRLAQYTGVALGQAPAQLAGGTTTNTQPIYQPSPLSQIAGLGMAGLGAASGLGWRPFG